MKTALAMTFPLLLLTPPQALAWGDTGHQTVCEIAFQLVGDDTRAAIRRLMKNDQEYDTFSEACIYPDHPHRRAPEHFINLERSANNIPNDHCLVAEDCQPKCPTSPKCLLTAIKNDFDVLANKRNRPADRLIALKYLGHWVGDIHQPLHVSFQDDRGGNDITVSGQCSGKFHSAWDTCLVEFVLEDLQVGDGDHKAAAKELLRSITSAQKANWVTTEPKDWANESFEIAERPETKYCVKEGTSCKSPPSEEVEIDAAYVQMSTPIIKERLSKAGVRLAHLLDEAFGD